MVLVVSAAAVAVMGCSAAVAAVVVFPFSGGVFGTVGMVLLMVVLYVRCLCPSEGGRSKGLSAAATTPARCFPGSACYPSEYETPIMFESISQKMQCMGVYFAWAPAVAAAGAAGSAARQSAYALFALTY